MIENVIYLAAILLIPVVPAFILYRYLPSGTSVSGPFKGLNINLKGSFAGFFLLVLIGSGIITYLKETQVSSVEYHYNLHFPVQNFPADMGKTRVIVKLQKPGRDDWLEHKDFSKKPAGKGIMVTVKNVSPDDILYVNAEYNGQKWESVSATVPVDHLQMTMKNNRALFDR